MQNEMITSAATVALTGRTVDEITADIRVNYRNAKASIIQIGRDLAEVRQLLKHGEWLPYLNGLNISISSAENYMRYASETALDDQLAKLPYSAAMALIALPEAQREQVQAQDLEGKSAAKIKRLIAEVKKEQKRADEAEQAAKATYREYEKASADCEALARDLQAERARPAKVIEKEVAPADYDGLKATVERLRDQLTEAEDAAADAEERANAAVAEAQRAAMRQLDDEEGDSGPLSLNDLAGICNDFQAKVWTVPFMGDSFAVMNQEQLNGYRLIVGGIKSWAERALAVMDRTGGAYVVEGAVVSDE